MRIKNDLEIRVSYVVVSNGRREKSKILLTPCLRRLRKRKQKRGEYITLTIRKELQRSDGSITKKAKSELKNIKKNMKKIPDRKERTHEYNQTEKVKEMTKEWL